MKNALFYCALVFTLPSFRGTKEPSLSLSALIIKHESKMLSVRVTLTNNTSDTLKYVGWNCSWQNDYLSNNDKWKIVVNLCFQNWYQVYQIPPHQSQIKVLQLERINGITK